MCLCVGETSFYPTLVQAEVGTCTTKTFFFVVCSSAGENVLCVSYHKETSEN